MRTTRKAAATASSCSRSTRIKHNCNNTLPRFYTTVAQETYRLAVLLMFCPIASLLIPPACLPFEQVRCQRFSSCLMSSER